MKTLAKPTPALVPGAVYITPMGRTCQLLPAPAKGPGSDGAMLLFAYLKRDGQRSVEDGFNMQPGVARKLLKRVA
jgi:hypothetical protein